VSDLNAVSKATIILRGFDYNQIRNVLSILSESRINSVEISLTDKESKKNIELAVKEFGDKVSLGAGTVLNKEDLIDVINLGVKFVLSPIMFTEDMFDICAKNNIVSVPGAFTPTEAYECFKSGADIVKIFPAAVVSPRFFKDIKAPIPDFKLMAVGGVNIQNSQKFLELGADYLGIGSGMFDKKDIVEGNYEGLKNRIAMLEHEIYRCK
jgi:2-dehydro-3-deoxyphosphogluconate aldolase / (4S)-4-hydroxy-2-oxoglutarate aldolase